MPDRIVTISKALTLVGCILCLLHHDPAIAETDPGSQPNFLFIAVDDLRPEIGAWGSSQAVTPNIDRLAAEGLSYTRHYVQAPSCGPSRFALLTGQVPTHSRHVHNHAIRTDVADASDSDYTPFPNFLRDNGYRTVALGKISHYPGGMISNVSGQGDKPYAELPRAWDYTHAPSAPWGSAQFAFFGYADGTHRNTKDGMAPPFEAGDVEDEGYADGQIAALAVQQIKQLSQQGQPFLLAVGFYKPHLPLTAPRKYWELYRREDIELSPNPFVPQGLPETHLIHDMVEFNRYKLGRETAVPGQALGDDYARELRHAYLAATSYVDAQIGKVLNALQTSGLADNTVVILWGDHGWHLGDHTLWGKHSLYERSLNSPLILKVPGLDSPGQEIDTVVETVDIYPTLAELAGLDPPEKLSGASLFSKRSANRVARSFWKASVSLRNDRFRIIVHGPRFPADVELYDHRNDKNETVNVIDRFATQARSLFEQARAMRLESKFVFERK